MRKDKKFEKWYDDQIWGNQCWKDGLCEAWQAAKQQSASEIASLKADNERLREALESMTDMCLTQIGADYNIEIHNRYEKAKQALSATPAQSTKGNV